MALSTLSEDPAHIDNAQIDTLLAWAVELERCLVANAAAAPVDVPDETVTTLSDPSHVSAQQLELHAARHVKLWIERFQSTAKEEVLREVFPDTPQGFFDEMWRAMEANLMRIEEATQRQAARLAGVSSQLGTAEELMAELAS